MDAINQRAFPLRIFGRGCPTEGALVSAHIENDDFLIIRHEGGLRPIPLIKIITRLQGTDLVLEWEQSGESYFGKISLSPSGTDQKAGWSPSSWQSMLKCFPPPSSHHQIETTGWFGISLFLLMSLSVIGFVCYLVFYKDIVALTSRLLPPAMEQQLGQQLWQQRQANLSLIEQRYANQVLTELAARLHAPEHYRWLINNSPEIQLISLPGGYFVVSQGLIAACQHADELAGIMAHEMAHMAARHPLEQALASGGIQLVWALWQNQIDPTQLAKANQQLNQQAFKPEQETPIDQQTLSYLQQANIDPQGWREFFDRQQRITSQTLPPLLQAHPLSEYRLPQLQHQPQAPTLAYDWQAVVASLTTAPIPQ